MDNTVSAIAREGLDEIANRKQRELMALGLCAYEHDRFNPAYEERVRAICDLEAREAELRGQGSQAIQNVRVIGVEGSPCCPHCGTETSPTHPFCPQCGGDLSSLRNQFKVCSFCGIYYTQDYRYCEQCGTPLPADTHRRSDEKPEAAVDNDRITCPSCGASMRAGSTFCGACGCKM